MHLSLKLLDGEELEFDVETSPIVIGRSNKCDIVIPHDGMSRHHCQIDNMSGELFVTDLGSTNGVLIDGQKIQPNVKTPYATFLSLSFGAVQSVQINFEENKPVTVRKIHALSSAPSKEITKPLHSTPKKPEPNKKNKNEKISAMLVNLMALFILGGAVWWFMQKEDETVTKETDTVSTSKPVIDTF